MTVGSLEQRSVGVFAVFEFSTVADVVDFQVEEADAVIYTERSRIWNPIHTDPRAARLAGLSTPSSTARRSGPDETVAFTARRGDGA